MTIQLLPEPEEPKSCSLEDWPEDQELTITKVERQRKSGHRYMISFGEYTLSVHEDVMIRFRMTTGSVFSKCDLLEIVRDNERQIAYAEGLRYLERKPRTAKEMADRLRLKEIGDTIIEDTLNRLRQERYIDDTWYARQWAEQRVGGRGKGKRWVRYELKEKGIDKGLIDEALDNLDPDLERESALQLARKKWRSLSGETRDKRRKTGAYLMRRGFPGELVQKCLSDILTEERENGEECEFDVFP